MATNNQAALQAAATVLSRAGGNRPTSDDVMALADVFKRYLEDRDRRDEAGIPLPHEPAFR